MALRLGAGTGDVQGQTDEPDVSRCDDVMTEDYVVVGPAGEQSRTQYACYKGCSSTSDKQCSRDAPMWRIHRTTCIWGIRLISSIALALCRNQAACLGRMRIRARVGVDRGTR